MDLNNYIIPSDGKIMNATFDEVNQIIKKFLKKNTNIFIILINLPILLLLDIEML